MGFIAAIKNCFSNYVEFRGRAMRSELWYFLLFCFLVEWSVFLIWRPLGAVWFLAAIVPRLAVGVRRLHDTGRTGWWLFIVLVPLVGWVVLLIWYCQRGDPGPNRYGDPAPAAQS